MRFLVVITLCLCVAFTTADWAAIKALLRTSREKCNADAATRVSDETYEKIKKGETVEGEENVKPFTLCMAKKMGWLNDEGKLQKDFLKEKIDNNVPDSDKRKEMMEKCNIEKDTPTETAMNIMRCLMKARREHFIP